MRHTFVHFDAFFEVGRQMAALPTLVEINSRTVAQDHADDEREQKKQDLIEEAHTGVGDFWPGVPEYEHGRKWYRAPAFDAEQEIAIFEACRDAMSGVALTPQEKWEIVERCILGEIGKYADAKADR